MTSSRAAAAAVLVSVLVLAACASPAPSQSPAPASSASSAASSAAPASTSAAPAEPTQSTVAATCDPSATVVEQTEGPYYKAGAPERSTISEADTQGIPLVLTGTVYDAACIPVPGATLDFWQADGTGTYDNSGYRLRGVQTTDAQGRYTLTTVVPGIYPGRTEHIHLKVTAPGGPTTTSQLYFPGVPNNGSDRIFVESMTVNVTAESADSMTAGFDFVLPR